MLDLITFFELLSFNFLVPLKSDFVGFTIGHHFVDLGLHIINGNFKTIKGLGMRERV